MADVAPKEIPRHRLAKAARAAWVAKLALEVKLALAVKPECLEQAVVVEGEVRVRYVLHRLNVVMRHVSRIWANAPRMTIAQVIRIAMPMVIASRMACRRM